MVASLNILGLFSLLFVCLSFIGSAEAKLFPKVLGADRPFYRTAYKSSLVRIPEEFCADAIRSEECKKCSECDLSKDDCTKLFASDTCWPAPTEAKCDLCFSAYGDTIFPKRLFTKSSVFTGFKSFGRVSQRKAFFSHIVDPGYCDFLKGTGICEPCSKCMGEGSSFSKCQIMFKTETCWPVPKEESCYKCFEEFGPEVFPEGA